MAWAAAAGAAAAGIAGATINAISSSAANAANVKLGRETNAMNYQMAQEQMAFQERMSSTAYQRAQTDLKRAGLNPILAATQGGASAPSGAGSNQSAPRVDPVRWGDVAKDGVASAFQALALEKDLQQKDAEIGLTQAAQAREVTQAQLNTNSAKNVLTQADEARRRIKVLDTNMPKVQKEAAVGEGQAEYDKQFQGFDNWLQRITNVGSGIGTVVNSVLNPLSGLRESIQRSKGMDKARAIQVLKEAAYQRSGKPVPRPHKYK